ncbi:hypothetical protein [Verminephrobacter aporrectodeae]|uniref:hypothetical protein n=1 Tax=Verminephrobacter aporrectodeae TaxID=1110389 RepID=UPI0022445ECC|nr:hypothetical protein [Verminephrobacter aporrectodeae]
MALNKKFFAQDVLPDMPPVGVGDSIFNLNHPYVIVEDDGGKVLLRITDVFSKRETAVYTHFDACLDGIKLEDVMDAKSFYHPEKNRDAIVVLTPCTLFHVSYDYDKEGLVVDPLTISNSCTGKIVKIFDIFNLDQHTNGSLILLNEDKGIYSLVLIDVTDGKVEHSIELPFGSEKMEFTFVKKGFALQVILTNVDSSNNLTVYSASLTIFSKQKTNASDFMAVSLGQVSTQDHTIVQLKSGRFISSTSDEQILVNFVNASQQPCLALLRHDKEDFGRLKFWNQTVMQSLRPDTLLKPEYKCISATFIPLKPTDNIIWTAPHVVEHRYPGDAAHQTWLICSVLETHFLNVDEATGAIVDKFNRIHDDTSPATRAPRGYASSDIFISLTEDIKIPDEGKYTVPNINLVHISRASVETFMDHENICKLAFHPFFIEIADTDVEGNGRFIYSVDDEQEGWPLLYDQILANPQEYVARLNVLPCFAGGMDYNGKSLRIGLPEFVDYSSVIQALALLQCIPFERAVLDNSPSLSFTEGSHVVNNSSTTTHSDWSITLSEHASVNLFGGYVSEHLSLTIGKGFSNTEDQAKSVALSFGQTISQTDVILGHSNSFLTWRFPVYIRTPDFDEPVKVVDLPMVFPQSKTPATELVETSSSEIIYAADYEVGSLLSYEGASIPGYDESKLLFPRIELDVTQDSGGATISYAQSLTDGSSESYTSHLTTSGGISVGYSGAIVQAGANFDFNISSGDTSTTSVTTTTDLNINIHAGSVKDVLYSYHITPLCYYSTIDDLLIVKYKIKLTGLGWKDYFGKPMVKCMALIPMTAKNVFAKLTRSIRYSENTFDKTKTDIDVHLFNNALVKAQNIACEFFVGDRPVDVGSTVKISPNAISAGKVPVADAMIAMGRIVATMAQVDLVEGTFISVKITHDGMENVYWNSYPDSYVNEVMKEEKGL